MPYLPRIVDAELDELLPALPAIALEGPKGVGKTATAARRAARAYYLDDPADHQLLEAGLPLGGGGGQAVLLDEWQRLPRVWDLVRRAVDTDPSPGRFLLTGSAAPLEQPTHSGAGRIVTVRMHPMSLAERQLATPTVSLAGLLSGARPEVGGECALTARDYAEEVCASGFPHIRSLPARPRQAQLDGYLQRVATRDFAEQGHRVRRPHTLSAWLRAYAAATATTASYTQILDAATAGLADKPARTTTAAYRDVLAGLWLLDPVPGWLPAANEFGRLAQSPKHHLADPALAARLLGATAESLTTVSPFGHKHLLGTMFESLATASVRVYAQAAGATLSHLRTANGSREVDLVVARGDGRVVACEVKLAAAVSDRDIAHLAWLRDRWPDGVLDTVVLTAGRHAHRRRDGVAVVPLALLGP